MSVSEPHVYYTISELAAVKDLDFIKNLNIRTLGYVHDNFVYQIDWATQVFEVEAPKIQLDLTNTTRIEFGIKPYIIFGVLYVVNSQPVLLVKHFKLFDKNFDDLIIYHYQLLEIRKRYNYSEHVKILAAVES